MNRAPSWVVRDFVGDDIPDLRSSVVLVGTPGPAQKITVQLWNERGVAGYLKYGETAAARRRLENERSVLAAVPESLGPAVLRYGTMASGVALLLSPVAGRALAPKLPPEKRLADFFQPASASQTASVEDHPWFKSLRARCGRRVDHWLEGLTGRKWPITLQHGDAAPWNMITASKQRLCAIDWEYGNLKGIPYLDLAYYVLQVALLVYRWAPRHARDFAIDCLCRNSAPALSRAEAEALAGLAACHAYLQSREDGHPNNAPYQVWRRAVWEHDA
jgi:hypothetical protein